jgi:hypothetical protein
MDASSATARAKYPCLACGAITLDCDGAVCSGDICTACGWEHDAECQASPDKRISPNYVSFNDHKRIVREFGANIAAQVNRAGGPKVTDLATMSPDALAELNRTRPWAVERGNTVLLANEPLVWMFHTEGTRSVFPSGVWRDRAKAQDWIAQMGASGILSAYVLDESANESNVRLGLLKLSEPRKTTPEFIRSFTTAVDHHHFEHGELKA